MLWGVFGAKGCKRWVAFLTVPKRPKWQINSYISSRPPASKGGDLLTCSRTGTSGINNTGNIANMFDEILKTFRIRVHHNVFFARNWFINNFNDLHGWTLIEFYFVCVGIVFAWTQSKHGMKLHLNQEITDRLYINQSIAVMLHPSVHDIPTVVWMYKKCPRCWSECFIFELAFVCLRRRRPAT